MSDATREDLISALRWLVDAGAEEAIAEGPVNRFRAALAAEAGPPGTMTDLPVPSSPTLNRDAPAAQRAVSRTSSSSNNVPRSSHAGPPPQSASKKTAAAAETISLSTAPGAARALAASCATLNDLKTAISNFEGCELKRFATNTVFADGNPESRIMLIGEAPGRDEDEKGLPFVGRAGKLLDRMLAAVSLDRSKVYITNVLNWRPPQNREPSPEEAAVCLPFLHRHIELANPQILILLGGVSVRHVLGLSEGILRARGRWETYQSPHLGRAIPAMPTLHPAYLLRQPAAKRLAWRDFLLIYEKLELLGLA